MICSVFARLASRQTFVHFHQKQHMDAVISRSATTAKYLAIAWCLGLSLAQAQTSQDAGQPQRVHRITLAEYEATLRYWQQQHPQLVTLDQVGLSSEGLGIQLLTLTDSTVSNEDKQVCLITALHGGPERSGTTTVLHLIEWLLSASAAAQETLKKQILLVMPINHPDAFFSTDRFGNKAKIDTYTGGGPQHWDLEKLEYKSAEKAPEVKAVLNIVDRWKPDVHADMHGTGLQEYPDELLGDRTRYQGQTMIEITGSAYSNYALRPWDWRITEAIIAAGREAGYPSDRFEADAQRSYHGPVMNPIADRTWRGQPNFYTAQYGYAKYHTMVMAFEVGWEQSGVARLKGLLRLGNQPWQNEPHAGYPVDRLKAFIGHYVTSWGQTAAQRRLSRVELWQKQGQFTQAVLYPQTDGRDTYFVATSATAAEVLTKDRDQFMLAASARAEVDGTRLGGVVNSGPEIMLAVDKARSSADAVESIQHGIGFRLRLPYNQPTIRAVRLNGHLLESSDTDGWRSWQANGYTQVQVNVPPAKSVMNDLYLITCEYEPSEVRRIGWTPPAEVLKQLSHER